MDFIITLHSLLRYIILALIFIVLINSLTGWLNKKDFTARDNTMSLYLLIACHSMLVLGLINYFVGNYGFKLIQAHGSLAMKDPTMRYFAVEHIFAMILAIVFIQIGRSSSKKASFSQVKHKRLFIYTLIGLLLILSRMPWPFMAQFSDRGWI
jgi:uncharacterized membrane protein